MPITFYPHEDDIQSGSIQDRLEVLMEAAERYKALVLDAGTTMIIESNGDEGKKLVPRELRVAYNWQELARTLREIRELPENNSSNKSTKADRLTRLAEVYEVLRSAKMPKLEAVRLALLNEAGQLRGDAPTPTSAA